MVRCGVAIYGLDPFGEDARAAGPRAGALPAQLRRRRQALRPRGLGRLRTHLDRRGGDERGRAADRLRRRRPARPLEPGRRAGRRRAAPAGGNDLDGQRHRRPRARVELRARRAGGPDRASGRRGGERRGVGAAARARSTTRSRAGSRPGSRASTSGERGSGRRSGGAAVGGAGRGDRPESARRRRSDLGRRRGRSRRRPRSRGHRRGPRHRRRCRRGRAPDRDAPPTATPSSSPASSPPGAWSPATAPGSVDVAELRGEDLAADLALRDFTVNAIAVPLEGGEIDDPTGGARRPRVRGAAGHVRARRSPTTRCGSCGRRGSRRRSASSPSRRPSSSRRLPPIAPASRRASASSRSSRRWSAGPDPLRGVELLDRLGATPRVLPELEALRGRRPERQPPPRRPRAHARGPAPDARGRGGSRSGSWAPAAEQVAALLAEPLADGLTRRDGLRFAALLHDIGKPGDPARGAMAGSSFIGHDAVGAEMNRELCRRLRTSSPLRRVPRGDHPRPPRPRLHGPRPAAAAAADLGVPAADRRARPSTRRC